MKKKIKKEKSKKDSKKPIKQLGKIVRVPIERIEEIPVYATCFESSPSYPGGPTCSWRNTYTGSTDLGE